MSLLSAPRTAWGNTLLCFGGSEAIMLQQIIYPLQECSCTSNTAVLQQVSLIFLMCPHKQRLFNNIKKTLMQQNSSVQQINLKCSIGRRLYTPYLPTHLAFTEWQETKMFHTTDIQIYGAIHLTLNFKCIQYYMFKRP